MYHFTTIKKAFEIIEDGWLRPGKRSTFEEGYRAGNDANCIYGFENLKTYATDTPFYSSKACDVFGYVAFEVSDSGFEKIQSQEKDIFYGQEFACKKNEKNNTHTYNYVDFTNFS